MPLVLLSIPALADDATEIGLLGLVESQDHSGFSLGLSVLIPIARLGSLQ